MIKESQADDGTTKKGYEYGLMSSELPSKKFCTRETLTKFMTATKEKHDVTFTDCT